ncbi:peptidase M66 [Meiothermus sp.]|uniref:peptidase M66 n=1 Tax=Meiothermus sp. TaxID=1955249 RepID=UPI0021DEEF24|nr:peptidase M66 [Meiothermus sp.]GIW34872.1 MAG: hypothetical protein KatS3mg072_2205 [Meiothermus sp.]
MRAWFGLALLSLAACNPSPSVPGPEVPLVSGEVTIQKTEWGQSVLKTGLRLVAGKPALLRVYMTADREGLPGHLKAEVFRGSNRLGELSFTGPATLPTAINPADLAQTYRATLPAAWVIAGMEVRLLADPSNQIGENNEADNRLTLTPAVGVGTVLPLTLVPVLQPGQTAPPTLPGVDLLRDMLPLQGVQTSTRAPFSYGATVGSASSDWSNLLSALRNLRTSDGSSRYYYGVVRVGYTSGIAGIGYVGLPVSAGWDFASSAARIMAHEIGHNLGRGHAPCNVAGESGYPYPGGFIGTWGYSMASSVVFNPGQYKDVMSYCTPQWISDYMYEGMQSFLERQSGLAQWAEVRSASSGLASVGLEANLSSAQLQNLGVAQEVLLVSGRIRGSEVILNPIVKMKAVPETPQPGTYRLRLEAAGGLVEVSFRTERVEAPHGPEQPPDESWSEEHFSLLLPDPGPLRQIEVVREGLSLYRRDLRLTRQSTDNPAVRLTESGSSLTLTWMPSVFPYASVAHLGQARTTLALWLAGGEARLSTVGLPSGGRWEIALSDGFNTQRLEFAR